MRCERRNRQVKERQTLPCRISQISASECCPFPPHPPLPQFIFAGLDADSGRRVPKYVRLAILFGLPLRLERQSSFRFTASSLPSQCLFPRTPTCLCCLPQISASECCPFPPHPSLTQSIFAGLDSASGRRFPSMSALLSFSGCSALGRKHLASLLPIIRLSPRMSELSLPPALNIRKRMLSRSSNTDSHPYSQFIFAGFDDACSAVFLSMSVSCQAARQALRCQCDLIIANLCYWRYKKG